MLKSFRFPRAFDENFIFELNIFHRIVSLLFINLLSNIRAKRLLTTCMRTSNKISKLYIKCRSNCTDVKEDLKLARELKSVSCGG